VQKNLGKSSLKSFRVNKTITSQNVRVIDENGSMLGVIPLSQALELSRKAGLDLVEVSPNVNPPVCKIANFGKMKYEMQKRANDAKKKQKTFDVKEVKLSINIGQGDYDFKMGHVKKFIAKGDKVKISIRLKGREMSHLDLAHKMIAQISDDIEEFAKFEFTPKLEGRQMVAILVKK